MLPTQDTVHSVRGLVSTELSIARVQNSELLCAARTDHENCDWKNRIALTFLAEALFGPVLRTMARSTR